MFINKVSLPLILNIVLLSSLFAQEKYFHELKGIEDSTGVTHLFYRMYSNAVEECSYTVDESYNISIVKDNIYQFNTSTDYDTLRFRDGVNIWSECSTTREKVYKYEFLNGDPDRFLIMKSDDSYWFPPILRDWRGNRINMDFTSPHNIVVDTIVSKVLIPTSLENIIVKAKGNNPYLRSTIRAELSGSNWEQINNDEIDPDSVYLNFSILANNPHNHNEYLMVNGDSLLRSLDHGDSLSFLVEDELFRSVSADVLFNSDDSYFLIFNEWSYPPITKELYKLHYVDSDWKLKPVIFENEIHAVTKTSPEVIYVADSSSIYFSDDQAESFSELFSFNQIITGLYKKPDSDLLYVLTKEELLELNTETKETTSLKKLPVSMEQEPIQIPKRITLHQNYPNPFNPTTRITYTLREDSHVELHIYDNIGRRLQTLVDERKTAGKHYVTFDASGYSSGIYYYQLLVPESSLHLVRKMILIK